MGQPTTVWLNVVRHPQQPINRKDATWEQFIDPAWQAANDDAHPERGPEQVAAGAALARLCPERPLLICHSGYRRTRRGAEMFAEQLRGRFPVDVQQVDALREAEIVWPNVMTSDEYADPSRPATLAFERIVSAIANDDGAVVRGGRATVAAQVEALRDLLAGSGAVNHLWVGHAPIMPFIFLGLVEGLAPEEWTAERAVAFGMRDFATGFSAEVALPAPG